MQLKIDSVVKVDSTTNKRGNETKTVITPLYPAEALETSGGLRSLRKELKKLLLESGEIPRKEDWDIVYESKVDGFHVKSPPADGRKLWKAEGGPSFTVTFVLVEVAEEAAAEPKEKKSKPAEKSLPEIPADLGEVESDHQIQIEDVAA